MPVPGFGAQAVLRAVNERTRLVALCNPNDPTGELVGVDALRSLLEALPERVVVLLDEALRDFVDAEERDAALALVEEFPRLLVFRTFSKAWGLAGLRVGYAVGGPGAEPLLEQLEPELGPQRAGPGRGAGGAAPRRRRGGGPRGDGGGRARAPERRRPRRWGCRSPPARPTSSGCARRASTEASSPAGSSATASSSRPAARWATTPACGSSIQRPEAGDRLLRALELSAAG